MHGLLFQGAKCENVPKDNKDAPDCLVRARLGPVRGGSTRAMGSSGEREKAGGNDWIARAACWAGREGGGGGEWAFGSWLRELFARVLVARVVFIEGARAFKDTKYILESNCNEC